MLIIAGPNGAGKTSVTGKMLRYEWTAGCVYINPDNLARDRFGDWNSPGTALQAARYATKKRHECLGRKNRLLFETVFSAEEKVDFVRQAVRQGYFVRLFFVGTNNPTINSRKPISQ
ncbi:hypothetical protein AGMMS49959_00130 [Planctomycetales bacterium]|nr:hypothetical protein AGMMS49959_00130 [Planctomycetales bacterium]